MKRVLSICLIISLILGVCCLAEGKTLYEDDLICKSCVLMDANTGEILFEKAADVRRYPASTTKIMTLLISIENCDGRKTVTVPNCASDITLDSTRVPVYPGERMPLRDLWYGLIFNSGNDAANAIAYLTSGSVKAFIEAMNEKARELGMSNTHFANAHGLHDPNHYTTARDMARLTYFALSIDLFREITFSTGYTMQATSKRGPLNLDHHYGITDYTSQYYYPYALGIKTGWHTKAGQCYIGAADKDGNELIAVVLFSGGMKNDKWKDAKKLFEYGFSVLEARQGSN